MTNALDLVRELRARTKGACINPECQEGHMCSLDGWCCDGCKTAGEALRHLNNLRVEYFERALGVMAKRDDPTEILYDIEKDAKAALS